MRLLRDPVPRRRLARGVALLEVMIALTILSIGLLGMMRLQILGITANGGARATTYAGQLATELASALERLDNGDARLAGGGSAAGLTAPVPFGRLLGEDLTRSHVHAWSDAAVPAMPGVRLDSALPVDPDDQTKPLYQRRWSVWDYETNTPTGKAASKIIAVSVIYRERGNPVQRELVVLTQNANTGLAVSYVAGYR
jgi:type IV pilus assembly protein PilV